MYLTIPTTIKQTSAIIRPDPTI